MRTDKLPPVERELPHEPGNYFSFKCLSADEADEAQAASVKEVLERYGPQAMEVLSKMAVPQAASTADAERDPLRGYSESLLVSLGLVGWRGPDYAPDDFSDDAKAKLDKRTRHWAAEQVVEISEITEGEAQSSEAGSAKSDGASRRSTLAPSGSQS